MYLQEMDEEEAGTSEKLQQALFDLSSHDFDVITHAALLKRPPV